MRLIYLVAGILLFSCTSEKPMVGFMLPHMGVQRYQIEKNEFTSKIRELGGDVIFAQANNDAAYQIIQLDSLIEAGINILVLDPVNRFRAASMVRKAHDNGIKVISYDRLISNSDVDAFVSFDAVMTGKQMAEAVTRLKPEGDYIILGGDKADLNAIGIDEGMQLVLDPFIKSGKIKIKYKVFIEKWAYDDTYNEVKTYLNLSGNVPDVIFAANDVMANGVIDLLKSLDLHGKVLVPGQGGDLIACQNIMKGYQIMTVYKPVQKLADLAADLALKMLKNENTSDILNTTMNNGLVDVPTHLLVTIPVNIDNIRSTVVADGTVKEEDLLK